MQADIYILAESFSHNQRYSNVEIEQKAQELAQDVLKIGQHSESNTLYANYQDLYPLKFHSTYSLEDFLCRPVAVKENVDRDVVNAVLNIFQKAKDTSFTSSEVIQELLP